MATYLVETYVRRTQAKDARGLGRRARAAARKLSQNGVAVRHIRTTLLPGDETCLGRTYRAGQSFVDRGDEVVHTALNRGTENAEFWVTYLVPGEPGAPARLDEPSAGTCPF